jgi:hypothetical protein
MKHQLAAWLLAATMSVTACSMEVATSVTFGVDGAPEPIKATFLVVSKQAARLAGYDAPTAEWMEFARAVCNARFEDRADLAAFVDGWAGPNAEPEEAQMWSTAASAATTAFCPIGPA